MKIKLLEKQAQIMPLLCRFDERTSAEKSSLLLCQVMRKSRHSLQRVAEGRGSRKKREGDAAEEVIKSKHQKNSN